jgi:hypothetical protein
MVVGVGDVELAAPHGVAGGGADVEGALSVVPVRKLRCMVALRGAVTIQALADLAVPPAPARGVLLFAVPPPPGTFTIEEEDEDGERHHHGGDARHDKPPAAA